MNLKDWTLHYIDYLNSFKKNLESKKIKEHKIECKYSDKGKIDYMICEDLNKCYYDEISVIVCLNKKDNIKTLIDKWNDFVKYKKLKIIFVNPKINQQWCIIPYLHHKFNEKSCLKKGLKSLFSSIPSV